ncbi:MAG TPA: TonB-dependent receptor [Burkholderiales bacterium]|nr:TonB-dependent receptor [Burkholderiales bacterium]
MPAKLRSRSARVLFCVLFLTSAPPGVLAAEVQLAGDLADLSLEELSNIEITSVSKRPERLADAPASIFVITAEDIRRSGATTIPEALRLAPNLEVAKVNSNTYAISARGFNNAIGNKLLVLIDGRTVYSPLFAGVFWDQQDVMLEDVERIEVIDGPGGTLWGANAVNGVINVITRSSQQTQGILFSAGSGNTGTDVAFRVGDKLGENATFRAYAKGLSRTSTTFASGADAHDSYERQQAGFRADWGGGNDSFTFQGDAYNGEGERNVLGTPTVSGSNLLGRWTRQLDGGASLRVQAYFDHAERDDTIAFRDQMDTYDLEFQHGFAFDFVARQKILWGGGYRTAHDQTQTSLLVSFIPPGRDLKWSNLFVQDEISLGRSVVLTLGAKTETNVYTGAEWLPSVRVAWKPNTNQLVWSAYSRAVRAPSRVDREFFFPGQPPFLINGGPNFQSEVSNVFEQGYRAQLTKTVSFSTTAFYAIHDSLRSGSAPPAQVQNNAEGRTNGVEAWGNYQVTRAWRLSAGFVELRQHLHLQPGSPVDPTAIPNLGNDPEHTRMLRSSLNLTDKHQFDFTIRHVSALPNPGVPAYTAVDARIGWRVRPDTELSLTLQNQMQDLFDSKHVEFVGNPPPATGGNQIGRSVFLKLVFRPPVGQSTTR